MTLRYPLLFAALLGLLLPLAARAQDAPAPATPATGDAVVDARLDDINRYAGRYPDAFVDELVVISSSATAAGGPARPQERVPEISLRLRAVAGVGRPCRGVIEAWSAGHRTAGRASRVTWASTGQRARQAAARGDGRQRSRWGRPLPPRADRAPP